MMDWLIPLAVMTVAILKLTLAIVLLIRTHTWTGLGRGLLFMFLIFSFYYTTVALRWAGVPIPRWSTLVFAVLAIIDCVVVLVALLRYDFEEPASGVQWAKLLGLKK